MNDRDDEDYLAEATLQLLTSKKKSYTYCISCGEIMKCGSVLVCSECLGDQCDIFSKVADLPEEDDES